MIKKSSIVKEMFETFDINWIQMWEHIKTKDQERVVKLWDTKQE